VSRQQASANKQAATPATRCAIYTRKSSDEGLQQEFNSLDAQREAAEAYIASQKAEGWVCLPDRYDDGGFTGGNMDRPALQRLLADIEGGKIDCVVVYKVDRLSRSLMDFARIVEVFERHKVSFVSVTQHFNTTQSMGRLTLNILLSFAQFEREIIGERIRDKIAASRQKGKWTGGTPILGYDVDRSNGSPRLIVNAAEASRVRQIFDLYLELGTLLPVVAELDRRGWRNKVWTTRHGRRRGGLPFDKGQLYRLLTNVLYMGKVTHKRAVYSGEHEAIVSEEVFQRVRQQLARNGRNGAVEGRNRHGALLRGLLYCKACGRAMSHTFTTRGNRRYRYYTCTNAAKRGRATCLSRSLPAGEVVADLLSTRIDLSRFELLERQQLAAVLQEADLSMTDIVENPDVLKGRTIKGAALLIVGTVAKVGDHIQVTGRLIDLQGRAQRTAAASADGIQNLRTAVIADVAAQLQETEAERLERAARRALGEHKYEAALANFDQAIRAYESELKASDSAVVRGKLAGSRLARAEANEQRRVVESFFAKAKDALGRGRTDEARGHLEALTKLVPVDPPELASLKKHLAQAENRVLDQIKGTWHGTITAGTRVHPVTVEIEAGASDLFSGTLRITGSKESHGVIAGQILSGVPETLQQRVWLDQARGEVKTRFKLTQILHGRLDMARYYYIGFTGNRASGAMIEERAANASYCPVQLSRERTDADAGQR